MLTVTIAPHSYQLGFDVGITNGTEGVAVLYAVLSSGVSIHDLKGPTIAGLRSLPGRLNPGDRVNVDVRSSGVSKNQLLVVRYQLGDRLIEQEIVLDSH